MHCPQEMSYYPAWWYATTTVSYKRHKAIPSGMFTCSNSRWNLKWLPGAVIDFIIIIVMLITGAAQYVPEGAFNSILSNGMKGNWQQQHWMDPFNGLLPVNYFSIFRYLSESSWKFILYGKWQTNGFAENRFCNNTYLKPTLRCTLCCQG